MVCAAAVVPTYVKGNVRPLENESVGVAPVPVKAAVCGEPDALSVAAMLAVTVPSAVGLNAIDSMQLAPAANDVEQFFPVSTKALELAPVMK